MQFVIKNMISRIDSNNLLSSSLDFFLNDLILEYKKRVLFVYNTIYFEFNNSGLFSQKLFFPKLSIYNINLYEKDFYLLKSVNSFKETKNELSFEILISLNNFINKSRSLGFFHSIKFRPIGNIRYISFDDNFIIDKFNCIFI